MREDTIDSAAEAAAGLDFETLAFIANTMPARVAYVDAGQTCRWLNKAYEDWFGLSKTTLCGRSIEELVGFEAYQRIKPHVMAALRGERVSFNSHAVHPNGGVHHTRLHYIPSPSGGFISVTEDVTSLTETQHALAKREEWLRATMDAGKVGVWEWNIQTGVVTWSDRIYEMHGLSREDFSCDVDGFVKALHPDDVERVNSLLQHCIATGKPYRTEFRTIRPSGEVRWISTEGQVFYDEAGNPQRLLGSTIDATDRKQAEEALRASEERFRLVFETALNGILVVDDSLKYIDANPAVCEMLGYTRDEIVGRDTAAFVPADFDSSRLSFRAELEKHGKWHGEFPLQRSDGGRLDLEWSVTYNKEHGLRLAVITDITERKEHERAIRELNAELEQRVAQRTGALQLANQEMEGFTYSVSHDLRAPLRAISSTSRILLDDYSAIIPEAAREQLLRQAAAAKKLGSLIDDLLKHSRIAREEMKTEPIDLSALVEDIGSQAMHSTEKAVQLRVEPGLSVAGDPKLMELVIQNLIENAIKFGNAGQPVLIEVGRSGNAIFVRDNGIGFEQQYADKIFQPFERLHRDEDYPGTGVGLANVRRIVERHGGTVWAEGEPNNGATFFFRLNSNS